MRLFIAVNFNNDTKNELLALRDELRSRSEHGRFSAPENLHLTLAFLGECDAKQTAAAKSAMDGIKVAPFAIEIECVGRFKRNGGDIWWAGVRESKPLLSLHNDLTDKLRAAGFILEKRRYSPHITLGREIVTNATPWQIDPFGETVTSIELMKSERINGKLTYTAIYWRD
jgi:2'-5' RNA ligase